MCLKITSKLRLIMFMLLTRMLALLVDIHVVKGIIEYFSVPNICYKKSRYGNLAFTPFPIYCCKTSIFLQPHFKKGQNLKRKVNRVDQLPHLSICPFNCPAQVNKEPLPQQQPSQKILSRIQISS